MLKARVLFVYFPAVLAQLLSIQVHVAVGEAWILWACGLVVSPRRGGGGRGEGGVITGPEING